MHTAVKLQVTIPKDRRVQLPEYLPEGRAEVIVLYPEAAAEEAQAHRPARGAGRRRAAHALPPEVPPKPVPIKRVSYFARLTSRQPLPLSAGASRALDEADRGER